VYSPLVVIFFMAVREHYYDRDSRRYAVLALGNLAMSRSSHEFLMSERGLDALRSCLQVDDDETRFNASYAVNKLSVYEDNITILGIY